MWFLQWVSLGGCRRGFHLRLSAWVSLSDSCGGCFFVAFLFCFLWLFFCFLFFFFFFLNFCGCW